MLKKYFIFLLSCTFLLASLNPCLCSHQSTVAVPLSIEDGSKTSCCSDLDEEEPQENSCCCGDIELVDSNSVNLILPTESIDFEYFAISANDNVAFVSIPSSPNKILKLTNPGLALFRIPTVSIHKKLCIWII